MSLVLYTVTVIDHVNNPNNTLANEDIAIRTTQAGEPLALIYEDAAGTIPIAQLGAKTNALGNFEFYAESTSAYDYIAVVRGYQIKIGGVSHNSLSDRNAAGAHIASAIDWSEYGETAESVAFKTGQSAYSNIILFGGGANKTGAENATALRAAKTATGAVFFPNTSVADQVYDIDGLTAADMLGLRWYADHLVLISLDSNQYPENRGSVFVTDVHFHFRDKLFQFTAKANPQAIDAGVRVGVRQADKSIENVSEFIPNEQLRGLQFDTQTDAVFSPISITDNGYYKTLAAFAGKTAGLFTNIAIGETVSAVVSNNVFSNNQVGVCIKSNTGYYLITKDPTVTGSLINQYFKVGVSSGAGQQEYPHMGLLTSYEIQNSTISVTRLNATDWKFSINGEDVGPTYTGIGHITEVGFIAQSLPATADVNIDVYGITKQKAKYFSGVQQTEQILIYGDSTADDFHGCFAQYLKQAINGVNGAEVVTVVNRAVAGTTLEEAYAKMQADSALYIARTVVLVAGTNNIQGNVPLATSIATLNSIFAFSESKNRRVIVVEPYMWYPKEIVDDKGQTTARYEFGATLRSAMQYETARRNHIFMRTTQLLARPDYNLVGTDNDPILRDNIHQSQMTYQLYAENIADYFIHSLCKIKNEWCEIPKLWYASGVSASDGQYMIKDGLILIRGTFTGSSPIVTGQNILNIPYPTSNVNFQAVSTDLLTTTACYVNVNNGVVTAQQIQTPAHNRVIMSISV